MLFLGWYFATQGGVTHLREQVRLMGGMADPTPVGEIVKRIGKFLFDTPTAMGATGPTGEGAPPGWR